MNNTYFESYQDLEVHKLMLRDSARVLTYKRVISQNYHLFHKNVVLDVGAGTGILSIFAAQAGAKKVYAVEAASSLIPLLRKVVAENEFSEIIEVIEGAIENVGLPEKVDIIISEWMGFYLLHEGMLESVIYAKKFLKEGGAIFPDECKIILSLCELPSYYEEWNDVYGVKMTAFGEALRSVGQNKPGVFFIDKECLLTEPLELHSFKISETEPDQLAQISSQNLVCYKRDGKYQGICIWFSVSFETPLGPIVLSTSPYDEKTHWKQTIISLPFEKEVEKGDPEAFEISLIRQAPRTYQITFKMISSTDFDHPVPCDCNDTKCLIIKTFMNKTSSSVTQYY